MKKRLLSALLALVMVLALLPVSVFAADPATTASYEARNSDTKGISDAPGWYEQAKSVVDGKTVTTYTKISNGYVVGGKYYTTLPDRVSGTITTIGNVTVSAPDATSLTVDVYSGSATITAGAKLTSLKVLDSKYESEKKAYDAGATKSTVNVSGLSPSGTFRLELENVDTSSAINLTGNYSHSVTLTNADADAITLDGTGAKAAATQTLKVNRADTRMPRNSQVGAIEVKGPGTIELYDCTQTGGAGVTAYGLTSVKVGGYSSVGDIEVGTLETTASTKALPNVTIEGNSAGDISIKTDEVSKGNINVSVNKNAIAGEIDMSNCLGKATVNVTEGTAGDITVEGGNVNVKGPYAHVGAVDLSGITTFALTGANSTVGSLKSTGKQVTINVPAEPTNTLGIGDTGSGLNTYTKGTILGGTWTSAVPKAALSSSLVYQLEKVGSFTYYNADQLGAALTDQVTSNGTLSRVGQDPDAGGYDVKFMNGKTLWGTLKIVGETQIKLPAEVATVKVTKWTDGKHSYNPSAMYPSPATATEVVLNAQGGVATGDVTKLTKVAAGAVWNNANNDNMGVVRASLSGYVISLSGAVPKGDSNITLTLTTDAIEEKGGKDEIVKLTVPVTYFSGTKTLTFSSDLGTDLGHGMTLETDDTGLGILRLSNGTKYTLNGSGLKERSNEIKVSDKATNAIADYNYIEVSMNVSSLKTQAQRDEVIAMLNGTDSAFDWSKSDAMKQAVNAALATITDSQVENWIKTAQRNAWNFVNTGTYKEEYGSATRYDTIYLVVYLQVNVTDYSPNGTLAATLVPSWRVEVRQSAPTNDRYALAFASTNNGYIAKSGTSLGQLTGEMGNGNNRNDGVTVKFGGLFTDKTVYMHQDNAYVYKRTNDGYLIKHAGSGSNGLGSVVINTTEDLVKLYSKDDGTGLLARYDSLQAAVNDALDGEHINVHQDYKGSMNINVTGFARKFTIQANGKNVVVANASGGLVDLNSSGGKYTVQLNRDEATVTDSTTATIAVTNVSNGSAAVSATTAKAGSTVTVTCTPAAGYRTSGVSVSAHMTKTNTNVAVTVTRSSANVYTFKVPEGANSITVTPSFVLDTGMPFNDVPTTDYYYDAVKYVYDNGLMNGNNATGTMFDGHATLTRAMVVTILYRAAGSPGSVGYNNFTDVPNNTWYTQAVTWANQNGVVTGDGNGTFRPTDAITRQELATILYRYNTTYKGRPTTGSTTLAGYTDQGYVSSWATAGMQWAVGNGIVNGTTTTTLTPGGNATRYQAATMLMRYGKGFGL